MYEEKPKRSIHINWKSLLIKLAILLVVVFLVIWIISLFGRDDKNESNFKDNLELMRNAATEYFTESRLPQEIDESERITLGEMFDQNLLIEFQDENGNDCDRNASYAEATMIDEATYQLEVSLVCENESDTISNTIERQNTSDIDDEEEPSDEEEDDPEEPSAEDEEEDDNTNTNNNNNNDNNNNNGSSTIGQNTNNSGNVSRPNSGSTTVNVTSVILNYKRIVVSVGQSRTVTAYIYPSNATNKTTSWSSSDASIATVNNGVITGHKTGTTTVTVQVGGKTASVEVVVTGGSNTTTNTCSGSKDYVSLYPLALIVDENCALSYRALYQNYILEINKIERNEYQKLYQEMKELGKNAGINIIVEVEEPVYVMNSTKTGYVGYQLFFTAKYKDTYSYKTIYAYYLDQNGNRYAVIDSRSSLK